MKLPTLADLNRVSQLMHGLDYEPLPSEFKMGVVIIAQNGVLAEAISELPLNLDIALREFLAEKANSIKVMYDCLVDIDAALSHVGHWFEKSRLYEP